MNYDDFKEYVREHWDNVLDIVEEGNIVDKMMKGMIKFSQSDNPVSKSMRERGMKQAKKYQDKHDTRLKEGLELIAEYIAKIIVGNVEDHGGKAYDGEVTPNKNGTAIVIKCKCTSCDVNDLKKEIEDYIQRCIDRQQVLSYDIEVSKTSVYVKIKLFK